MNQVDNLQAGDIVLFLSTDTACDPDVMGFVVNDHPNPNDEQGVLIQFYGGDDYQAGPLHYYHYELDAYLEEGTIRIMHAS